LTYKVIVVIRPEVALPDYSELSVTQTITKVNDEQVDAEIERLRERTADFAEVADEGILNGDYVTVDYTMTVNGEDYPEGETTGYPLEIGTDTFFPELNEGLLGVKQGEVKAITTTYPEDYTNKDLAGKTAEFDITIQQVRRVLKAEPNDEWAQAISQGSIETIDALRGRIQQNLQLMATQADHDHVRNELIRQLVEKSTMDLPEALVDEQFDHQMQELEQRLSRERMSMDELAEVSKRSIDDLKTEQMAMARDYMRRSFVLQEIARRENLFVTDADVDAVLATSVVDGRSPKKMREELQKAGQFEHLVSRIFHEKVLSFIESKANITLEGAEGITAPESPTEESAEEPTAKKRSRKKAE